MNIPTNSTATNPDPFTQAYRALRDWFLSDPDIKAAPVKAKCIIDLTGDDRNPVPDNPVDSDFPELVLSPTGGAFQIGRTNIGHGATMSFNIRLSSGDITLAEKHFPVLWALGCAFARLHRIQKGGIPAGRLGLPFIEKITPGQFTSSVAALGGGDDRGTIGWVTLLSIELRFQFSDNDVGAGH